MEGYIFICGSTVPGFVAVSFLLTIVAARALSKAMGNGVLDALAEVLEGGKETVEALRGEGRIVAETWHQVLSAPSHGATKSISFFGCCAQRPSKQFTTQICVLINGLVG